MTLNDFQNIESYKTLKKKKKNERSEHHLFVLLVHVVMVTYLTTCGYGNAFEIMKDPLLYYNDNYQ